MSEPMPAGLRIGHTQDDQARTGCTVFLGPFRGACEVRGLATGSRELETLSPLHLAGRAHAILLTGGSAFGLAAADGVMAWHEERGIGFDTGVARVPIVPAAVIFDLMTGDPSRRPDAAMGRAACDAATAEPPAQGRIGAGIGATAGKILGPAAASPGGFGFASEAHDGHVIAAGVVVNALGDVLNAQGEIIAGARAADGSFADATRVLRAGRAPERYRSIVTEGTNTTLAVVITDAPIARGAMVAIARMAGAAFGRRIRPVFSPFDGDIVFAVSTAEQGQPVEAGVVLEYGAVAAHLLEAAIERAVS